MSHLRRVAPSPEHPLLVILRVGKGVPSLRSAALSGALRGAIAGGRERSGFRLVCYGISRDGLDLLVEAKDRRALALGMQGVSVRMARALNRELGRTGRLFADRYEARSLTSGSEVRAALDTVLAHPKHRGVACAPQTRLLSSELERSQRGG